MKAVIFDFDGVLFDSTQLHFESTQAVLAELGLPIDFESYQSHYLGMHDVAIFQKALPHLAHNPPQIRSLIQRKIQHYLNKLQRQTSLPAIPGVLEFVKFLRQHTDRLAIFTNGSLDEVHPVLTRLAEGQLHPHFQFLTTIDDVSQGKPHPEGYLLSAQKLQVNPSDCIVIEDSLRGIEAAKAAGMTVIGLGTSLPIATLQAHAHQTAKNYAELISWLSLS